MRTPAVACVLVLGAFGQTAAPPVFEVASIKPSDPMGHVAVHRSGYHLSTTSTSLLFLITWAYDVHSDLVFNQPDWLDSVRYDVVANGPQTGEPAKPRIPGQPSELQKMMQALLAERFKLSLHRETRELAVFTLIVAKGGPKVSLSPAPDVGNQNPFRMPGSGRLVGTQVSTEMLAKFLSSQLDRSVQDETGLKGVFDFKLEWQPEGPRSSEAPTLPSLFTALQEQLGLKLETRKTAVEVLVIDHIEKAPTEN